MTSIFPSVVATSQPRTHRASSSSGATRSDRRQSNRSTYTYDEGESPGGTSSTRPRQSSRAASTAAPTPSRTPSASMRNPNDCDNFSSRPIPSPRRPRLGLNSSKHIPVFYGAKGIHDDAALKVNVAVVGNSGVGKSTLIRKVLGLADDDDSTTRTMSVSGVVCAVHMYEMTIAEVYNQEEDKLAWPESMGQRQIHGVVTLYDVGNKAGFKQVPEVLNGVNKTGLPSVLAACKCDLPVDQRALEPRSIEQRASSAFDKLTTLQTSEANQEPFRRAIAAILSAVVASGSEPPNAPDSPRRRTLPSVPQRRVPNEIQHARSSSELTATGRARKDSERSRHDSSQTTAPGAEMARSIRASKNSQSSQSFLMEGSVTDDSDTVPTGLGEDDDDDDTSDTSSDEDNGQSTESDIELEPALATPQTPTQQEDYGWTFETLVDRLLSIGTHKSDSTFAAVFLALYRKFAAPGQLLEAIVLRFELLDKTRPIGMLKIASQLRYLCVMEQWIHLYPGDFAHATTLRRIKTFITKLDRKAIFATAAKEMRAGLEFIAEDDDTEWACCDKDRKLDSPGSRTNSMLIDDPDFEFLDGLDDLALVSPASKLATGEADAASIRPGSLRCVDLSQREAAKLVPNPRFTLTKVEWRSLLDLPDETIAKEMTRMDWLMFSSIRPRDLVRYVSLSAAQKKQCKSLANVQRMVDHFNFLRSWVVNYILHQEKPKHRAAMLEKFMIIARKLRELNNYNSLGAVLAALESTPVHRLTATKDLVHPEVSKDWMALQVLMSQTRSYTSYRLAWENSNAERIPYLPLPIRDLTTAEIGNKTFIGDEADGKINWRKFEVMGDVLVGIQRAQGLPYRAATLQAPQTEFVRALFLHTIVTQSDDMLYDRSKHVESNNQHASGAGRLKELFKR